MWLDLAIGELAHATQGKALNMPVQLRWPFLLPWHFHENILLWAYNPRKMRVKWSKPADLLLEAEAAQLTHRFMRINNYFKTLNFGVICYSAIADWYNTFLINFHGVVRRAPDKETRVLTFIIVLPLPWWFCASCWAFWISVYPHQWNSFTEAGAENIALLSLEYLWCGNITDVALV